MPPAPIYTAENCNPAYQLNWSVTVFWSNPMSTADWLAELRGSTEPDGVRVLEHSFARADISQFLVSTTPAVSPYALVRSVKGRLQYLVRHRWPKAFRHKYGLRSMGSAKREDVENYVRSQTSHHPMADPRVQSRFERYQICNPAVDLSQPRQKGSGVYWYNLHLVFVHTKRFRDVSEESHDAARRMILAVSAKEGYLLSRAGIVADHVHLTVGCPPEQPPAEVALRYMNNIAYSYGMKPSFAFGFYAGTIGEYDLNVIPWGGG
jgi:REP element-mobilizing transposase RayT